MTWKQYITTFLHTEKLITLSTISENIPWSSPTYFTFNKKLHIYLLLETHSQHYKNLIFLPKASIMLDTDKTGEYSLQIIGDVEILDKKSLSKVEPIARHLLTLHTSDINQLNKSSSLDWRLIKIIPNKIYLVCQGYKEEITLGKAVSQFFTN